MRSPRDLSKTIFTAPYPQLPWAVFVFFCACFLLHPLSPVYTQRLNDPDDYMRLNEVMNWLSGQGWYDLGQPRLSPGSHTVIHWSRLVDIPIALVMLPLRSFMSLQGAALTASFVVPPLLFALLLLLLPALAKPILGPNRANLTCVFLLFAPMVVFNFTPGRVDHHAYQILIAGFGLLCLERILNDARGWIYAVLAAVAFACGLWIGTEALPWLILFTASLALLSVWQGGYALRHAAIFGLSLLASTLIVLPLALPFNEFSSRALSWFSLADVIFAGLVAVMFAVSWLLGGRTRNRGLRFTLLAALAFCAAALFVLFVPDVLAGPFADYDYFNSTIALDNIVEAQPLAPALLIDPQNLFTLLRAFKTFIHALLLPLVALGIVFWNLRHSKNNQQKTWLLHGIFLLSAFLLTLFWQVRVGYFMQLFAIAPLVWLAGTAWDKIGARLKGRPRFWAEAGIFLALGPLPVILFPAFFNQTPFYPDILLFPVAHAGENCPLKNAADFLNRTYRGRDITILAGMNEGSELLFRTPFKIVGANYNVTGNQDVFDFFHSRDDAEAQRIVRKWKADFVLTCRDTPPFIAGFDHPHFGRTIFLEPKSDGKLHFSSGLKHPVLVEKLVNNTPPAWLKPVEIPGDKDYLLFTIH